MRVYSRHTINGPAGTVLDGDAAAVFRPRA
jgi:hypothetical protein